MSGYTPTCIQCGTTNPGKRRRGRCDLCYSRYRAHQKAFGRWQPTYIDGEPTRKHIRRLIKSGLTQHAIAVDAGINQSRIHDLMHGGRISRTNAARILAITPLPAPEKPSERYDEVLVQRVISGTYRAHMGKLSPVERRTVLAYATSHGWSHTKLAQHLDCTPVAADRALVRFKEAA